MKKKILSVIILMGSFNWGVQLKSQNYSDTINHIFEYVDKSKIITGLLSDYGVQMVDLSYFNGIPSDSNYVDINTWKKLYTGIYTSKINSNISLDLPDDVDDLIDNSVNSPVPLAMMHYSYNKVNDDAVSQGLLQVVNNQIYDVQGASSPYFTRQLFAVAPKSLEFNSLTASFVYNSDLWFSNSGKTIQKLDVNFNNESGYLTTNWNMPINYTFSTSGTKTIYFRLTYTDGSYYTSQTNISVKSNPMHVPGLLPIEIPINANSDHSGGTLQIQYASSNYSNPRKIRKALIIAEGYDVDNIIPGYGNDINSFLYEYWIDSKGIEYPKFGSVNVPYSSSATLVDALDDNDFDIVYLNYNNGVDDIKRNAKLLEAAIDTINKLKENNEINVVMGISMGGLVARYALRDMELNNKEHNTIKFISIDSPHKGANVPVGAQAFVRHLQPLVLMTTLIEQLIGKKIIDEIGLETIQLLNSPATKQLLTYYVSSDFNYDNSVHNSFYTELESMGFPKKCQNMAVTDGAGNAIKNFDPESNIINFNQSISFVSLDKCATAIKTFLSSINTYPNINLNIVTKKTEIGASLVINSLPDKKIKNVYTSKIYIKKKILWVIPIEIDLMKKTLNSTSDMVALDGAPGGTYDLDAFNSFIPDELKTYVNQTKFCFIPTTSALCLSNWKDMLYNNLSATNLYTNGTCPFEYYFTQTDENKFHTRFNEVATFLYDHLYTNYALDNYTQNETLNTSRYIGGNNIYMGNNVTTSKPQGNVTINNGANIIADGQSVTLDAGFECSLGSTFEVKKH